MRTRSLSRRLADHLRRNVYGLIAIFIALSGTAAALPGRNSVNSGDIKKGAVRKSDIRRNAVNRSKIRRNAVNRSKVINNSLKGADIDEDSLSGVLRCRSVLNRAVDVCYSGVRGPAAGGNAVQDCADENLRLPSAGELAVIAREVTLPATGGEWTDYSYLDVDGPPGVFRRNTVVEDPAVGTVVVAQDSNNPHLYRCVTTPSA
ncbi:MAG: hypothetical protein ACRDKV_09760 [Solirubrobacterales bacterium]